MTVLRHISRTMPVSFRLAAMVVLLTVCHFLAAYLYWWRGDVPGMVFMGSGGCAWALSIALFPLVDREMIASDFLAAPVLWGCVTALCGIFVVGCFVGGLISGDPSLTSGGIPWLIAALGLFSVVVFVVWTVLLFG